MASASFSPSQPWSAHIHEIATATNAESNIPKANIIGNFKLLH
jgi:hypothetical protein